MANHRYLHCKRGRYYFRRRIPGLPGHVAPMTVALGTTDFELARLWSTHLMREFDRLAGPFFFVNAPLPDDLVRQYFQACLEAELREISRQGRLLRMSGRWSAHDDDRRAMALLVLTSMVEDGIRPDLPPERVDPTWTRRQLDYAIDLYRRERDEILSRRVTEKFSRAFRDQTGHPTNSLEHDTQLREANLRARIAALQSPEAARHFPSLKPSREKAPEASDRQQTGRLPETGSPAIVPTALNTKEDATKTISAPHKESVHPGSTRSAPLRTIDEVAAHFNAMRDVAHGARPGNYSDDLAQLFWRVAEAEKLSDGVIMQRAADLRLFIFVTGIKSAKEITAHHAVYWRDMLNKIPKNFLRSSKDRTKDFPAILMAAKNLDAKERGLSSETIRRHIKSLEIVLDRAIREGHIDDRTLICGISKPKKVSKSASHKRRSVFRFDELKKLFSQPLWQGGMGPKMRHAPGAKIIRDSRYWIPLILAYTGARRAEISGLLTSDIIDIDQTPCIIIQSNEFRGIKGEAADAKEEERLTRIVPIHSHLIDLGLLKHVSSVRNNGDGLLFADVVPKRISGHKSRRLLPSIDAAEKFGETIDYTWRGAVTQALDGNPRKLCLHSLRHYVNNFMLNNRRDIADGTRFEIMGHVESEERDSVNTTYYRDEATIPQKKAAIEMLPRIF